jgi:integrase
LDLAQEIKLARRKQKHTPTENEVKATPKIQKLLEQVRNDGRTAGTVSNYRKTFNRLLQAGADLFDPENTKAVLANLSNKPRAKKNMVAMLSVWYDFNGIGWRPPKYTGDSGIPFLATESQLDTLIAAVGKKTAAYLQLLKETGARPGEISDITWESINFQARTIRIAAEKGSNSRILPISLKAIEMLSNIPQGEGKLFCKADSMRTTLFYQRRRIAKRLAAPELKQISFKTFRHWKGTTEQHRTKDPWHVKLILGHKSITSTETYIHYEQMIYQSEANDQFITKVALNVEEACKLIDVGFEYVTGEYNDGGKIFRKRK